MSMPLETRPPLTRRKKFIFASFIMLLLAFVCEGVLHVWPGEEALNRRWRPVQYTHPEYATNMTVVKGRFIPHPFLPYAGRPNIEKEYIENYTFKKDVPIGYKNNNYGFRTHPFPRVKNPEDYFVLCFGGSTTWGCCASNDLTWPALLEKKLQAKYPQRNVKVFNMAIDAGVSPMSVVTYALIGVHVQPDLVVVYQGTNDLINGLGGLATRTDYSHAWRDADPTSLNPKWRGLQPALPAPLFNSAVVSVGTKLIDNVTGARNDLGMTSRKMYMRGFDPLAGIEVFLQNLKTMSYLAKGQDAEIVYSTFHWFADDHKEFNRGLRGFFAENNYMYVDQAKLIPKNDYEVNIDIVHFTDYGRELMAQNYFDYIVEKELVPPGVENSSGTEQDVLQEATAATINSSTRN